MKLIEIKYESQTISSVLININKIETIYHSYKSIRLWLSSKAFWTIDFETEIDAKKSYADIITFMNYGPDPADGVLRFSSKS